MLEKRQNDRLRSRLFVERLEDRTVLSGNVTALLDPSTGLLSIIGDGNANAIAITQENGTDIVTGETATSINGADAASFDNVTGISIQFLDNNDSVAITSVVLPGAITISAGIGSDTITLVNSTFQQADISAGTEAVGAVGNNVVDLRNDVISGNHLNISLLNESGLNSTIGDGSAGVSPGSANTVNINNVQFAAAGDLNLTVDDGFSIFDGTEFTGSSSVTMAQVNTAGDVNVSLGNSFLSVQLGAGTSVDSNNLNVSVGNDVGAMLVNATVAQNEHVTLGDATYLLPTASPPSIVVSGSAGNDLAIRIGSNTNAGLVSGWPLQISESVRGDASIMTGDGAAVDIEQTSVSGFLNISLGSGGANNFESLTLRDVTSADLSIGLRSNSDDLVSVNLANVAVTDTTPLINTFVIADFGGTGGFDNVTMVNVQVAGGMQIDLSATASSILSATDVTCVFGSIDVGPGGTYKDGGGNSGF